MTNVCLSRLSRNSDDCVRYLNDLVAAVPDLHIKLPKKRDMVVAEAEGAPEVDTDLLSKCVPPPADRQ